MYHCYDFRRWASTDRRPLERYGLKHGGLRYEPLLPDSKKRNETRQHALILPPA